MKKIVKKIIIYVIIIGISLLIYFVKTPNALLAKKDELISLIFILFGFILACYTFIISILEKIVDCNSDTYQLKKAYINEFRQDLFAVFIIGIIELLLDLFYNAKFSGYVFMRIIDYFSILFFVFAIFLVLDILLSIFKIITVSTNKK